MLLAVEYLERSSTLLVMASLPLAGIIPSVILWKWHHLDPDVPLVVVQVGSAVLALAGSLVFLADGAAALIVGALLSYSSLYVVSFCALCRAVPGQIGWLTVRLVFGGVGRAFGPVFAASGCNGGVAC